MRIIFSEMIYSVQSMKLKGLIHSENYRAEVGLGTLEELDPLHKDSVKQVSRNESAIVIFKQLPENNERSD